MTTRFPSLTRPWKQYGVGSLSSLDQKTKKAKIKQLYDSLGALTPKEALALQYDWSFWARDAQLPPQGNDWNIWLILAGRGFGKTRTGAETTRGLIASGYGRIALVAPTASDARDVIVEGESGVLATSPPGNRPHYEPSKRRLTWSNGAIATTYSADEPDRLRGPQHDAAWCDELAAWRYPDTWDMLMFGLRLGKDPISIVTTTPRPTQIIKDLINNPKCVVTRGSTFENQENLASTFIDAIKKKYEGTRLGRQELYAEVLDDNPGALWNRRNLEENRIKPFDVPHPLKRIVIAIDPAVTSGEESDETGLIAAGIDFDDNMYVLDDRSGRYAPEEWAREVVAMYRRWDADKVVAETNNGGDMVEHVLRMVDPNISYAKVHASRGKLIRAEPVAALYAQNRVHHVGVFALLEDQMCGMTVDMDRKTMGSPDRVDALVWAAFELIVAKQNQFVFG